MLHSLHIRNYVLIDSLDITFPEGLVIITGQTGAGKSILLGALSLLSGGKADAGAISSGQESCVVEAEYSIDGNSNEIRDILDEAGIDWDPERLIVRRTVNASGRSRCFVNDIPTQLPVLEALSSRLIDIHSQHQSLLLTDRRFQLGILDHFCSNTAKVADCRRVWGELQEARKEYADLSARLSSITAESEYNRARFQQLKDANLKEGELESLEAEQKQLANAETIKENLSAAGYLLDGDGERSGVSSSLKDAARALQKLSSFIPEIKDLCDRMDSARIEIDDIAATIEDMNLKTDLSSERLQSVEDRLSLIYSLLKKHGVRTVEELVGVRDSLEEIVGGSGDIEDRMNGLSGKIAGLEKQYDSICSELHTSRTAHKDGFAAAIQDSLRYLELDRSLFRVDVSQAPDGPSGRDSIQFSFSSTGSNPIDVAKCASGGEISRIMLCLKAMMARFTGMPTHIFDEIDTGVSGSVADKMGTMICEMGRSMQVFSITHLPQVAAKGNAHYVVTKEFESGKAVSRIHCLNGEERVMEIARLLSGSSITPEAVANAKALIGE